MRVVRTGLWVLAVLAALAVAHAQGPAARTALVVGNADYAFGPLKNPINDAEAMAKSLEEAGFEVILEKDAGHEKLEESIKTLRDQLKERGGVGLFYFSGHGAQISGENYLLPAGDEIGSMEDVKTRSLTATEVVDAMAKGRNGLNIVILDACRNNPIDPSGSKGLSRIDSNASLFVSYATSPGMVALDGAGNNSPYTKYLAQFIAEPNLTIEDTFKRTLKGVYVDTKGEQTPWISSTFFGDFVFRPEGEAAEAEDVAAGEGEAEEAESAESLDLAGVYRVNGSNPGDGSTYRGMAAVTENDDADDEEFDFTWWIGKDVFHGTGHLAGKMLVVNFGQKDPVIYTFGDEGELDGEWADGSATETLEPVAIAAPGDIDLWEGTYKVEGKNGEGKAYSGTVDIESEGDAYRLSWHVEGSDYEGTGKLSGNLLTVDWDNATPVVYALAEDGSLTGLWDAGHGEETLTPED
jgi:hypothetical protein